MELCYIPCSCLKVFQTQMWISVGTAVHYRYTKEIKGSIVLKIF